jgi:curved DNA-binding protein
VAQDYYSELGVKRSSSEDEIRKVYRKLAAELHPDRNPGKTQIEDRFKRVNTAFHVLSDAKKRKLYDEFGEMGLREGFDPNMARGFGRRGPGGGPGGSSIDDLFGGGGGGIGDIFGDIFGGGRGRRRPQKAPDLESEVTIEFVSAVRGAELELAIQTGRTVKVRIPKGAQNGDKMRVKGAGGTTHPGASPADLLLVLKVKKHPYFERDGLDLTVDLPISVGEAFDGASVEVPTTSGTVQLKIPAHTQSGQRLRLRGKGVTRGNETGDLYVRFMLRLPTGDDDELKKAIAALDEATPKNLRESLSF